MGPGLPEATASLETFARLVLAPSDAAADALEAGRQQQLPSSVPPASTGRPAPFQDWLAAADMQRALAKLIKTSAVSGTAADLVRSGCGQAVSAAAAASVSAEAGPSSAAALPLPDLDVWRPHLKRHEALRKSEQDLHMASDPGKWWELHEPHKALQESEGLRTGERQRISLWGFADRHLEADYIAWSTPHYRTASLGRAPAFMLPLHSVGDIRKSDA
jgi:hypothetical protein